jgi:hypothetical protein
MFVLVKNKFIQKAAKTYIFMNKIQERIRTYLQQYVFTKKTLFFCLTNVGAVDLLGCRTGQNKFNTTWKSFLDDNENANRTK